ncbi:MAG: hydrogenase formation protein HypD [Leptolyngbyaceae cyanobacterium MO_188.B28]|nr:hydrogenase formation protein HypD [Leptolyngbyaceae cyanobacterium MO_188.B28]
MSSSLQAFYQSACVQDLLYTIQQLSQSLTQQMSRPLRLMVLCGPQTLLIEEYQLKAHLPPSVEILQGFGLAAWSLPIDRLNHAITLAERPNVILAATQDTMRIRGSKRTLIDVQRTGANIHEVASADEAFHLAVAHPDQQVVYFAVGFEDYAALTAQTIQSAAAQSIDNFSVYCNHTSIIPALKAVLDSPILMVDGFIGAADIPQVTGLQPYEFLADSYHKPIVIAENSPLAILQAIVILLRQRLERRNGVETQTTFNQTGDSTKMQAMMEVLEPRDFYEWRGMGSIDYSGLKLRTEYEQFDADIVFDLPKLKIADPHSAQCWAILSGVKKPCECKVFGASCNSELPMGTFMTSPNGACALAHAAVLNPSPSLCAR